MEKKVYAALIYNQFNVLCRIELRPTRERAEYAGRFISRKSGWYRVIDSAEELDMYSCMVNM